MPLKNPSVENGIYDATVSGHLPNDEIEFNIPDLGLVVGKFSQVDSSGMRDGLLAIGNQVKVVMIDGLVRTVEEVE